MAQCEQCGNFDDQEIENDYGVFDLGKRPKRRKGYQPELYYYWHGDIEEDYQMPDGMCCMCEICFDIANTEGRIKWVDDKNPFTTECKQIDWFITQILYNRGIRNLIPFLLWHL